jgi:C1A family cysteine protease
MSSLDWRNHQGVNMVTPVQDQGRCGSCWAFACIAALESQVLMHRQDQKAVVKLSEQVLVSCSGAGNCAGGYIDQASNYLRDHGAPPEACYPYLAEDGDCQDACPEYQNPAQVQRLKSWQWIARGGWVPIKPTVEKLKQALITYGPLVVGFQVYEDFIAYESGVYEYVEGEHLGGHAVLLVGYDDKEQCFICKNSWGTDWGEQGFFRIAYSEVG